MPLELIPHQPFFTDPNRPPGGICVDDIPYCHLVAPGDAIWLQFYQTPCGNNEVEDETFIDSTDGAQLLLEPDFTTVVNWIYIGISWNHAAGKLTHVVGNTDSVAQATALAAGWHKLEVVIADTTAGSVNVAISGTNAGTSADLVADGTYTFYLYYTAGAQITISPSSDFDGALDSCKLYATTFNKWTIGSAWTPSTLGGLCKTDDTVTATATESVANYLTVGEYYECMITIESYGGAGSITVNIADISVTGISGDGTTTVYGTPTVAGVMEIVATTDFTGCVTIIDTRMLRTDYAFTINGSAEIAVDSADITYNERWVIVQIDPEDYLSEFECFTILVNDECDLQYGEYLINKDLTGGGVPNIWSCPNWQRNNAATQYDASGNQLKFIFTRGLSHVKNPLFFNDQQPAYIDNVGQVTNYRITFDIASITTVPGDGIETELVPNAADMGAWIVIYGQTTAASLFTGVGTHTYDVALPANYGQVIDNPQTLRAQAYGIFDIDGSGLANEGNVVIENMTIERLEPYEASFETECMKYTSAEGTILIQGTCSAENALGFDWTGNFILSQRIRGRWLSTNNPMEDEQYTYSSGDTDKYYAERSKYWELFVDMAPASVHDTLTVQIQCNNLQLGKLSTDLKAYVAKAEYDPEYERTGASNYAQGRLEIKQKLKNTIFNRNC